MTTFRLETKMEYVLSPDPYFFYAPLARGELMEGPETANILGQCFFHQTSPPVFPYSLSGPTSRTNSRRRRSI